MAQYIIPTDDQIRLRKQLMKVVLRDTLRKTGLPPDWLGGETKVITMPNGEIKIELQLSVQIDEPRFLTYLTAFQADFLRRLFAIEPGAEDWFFAFTWRLRNDPVFEVAMPAPEYWTMVASDREVTARQKGALEWDQETLHRHFSETAPGDLLVDFDDKKAPTRAVEDIGATPPPPGRR
jgi:hypothetical protein